MYHSILMYKHQSNILIVLPILNLCLYFGKFSSKSPTFVLDVILKATLKFHKISNYVFTFGQKVENYYHCLLLGRVLLEGNIALGD